MPKTFSVTLDGAMLRRGFWLYVWEIKTPDGKDVLYVGRTGDNSSPYAQSLFQPSRAEPWDAGKCQHGSQQPREARR
jgi:hypothetical protein